MARQTKETTPFIHWKANVIAAAGVSVATASAQAERILRWFDMGEDANDAAEMLKAFTEQRVRDVRPSSIAVRWFRDGVRIA
jgi:hypothetical protein